MFALTNEFHDADASRTDIDAQYRYLMAAKP
jgi:hypothetical protein